MIQERISVFDIFKIGIGPSSSHTMGPWRAAQAVLNKLQKNNNLNRVTGIKINLFGSLAKTGKGHGTGKALMLGFSGEDPVTIDPERIDGIIQRIHDTKTIILRGGPEIRFDQETDILHRIDKILPYHPNGMTFEIQLKNDELIMETYYSIGGGFIVCEGQEEQAVAYDFPYPIDTASDIIRWSKTGNLSISKLVMANELAMTQNKTALLGICAQGGQSAGAVMESME